MLLAADVGNTNITLGLFGGADLQQQWRVQTDRNRTADEYDILLASLLQSRNIDPTGVSGFVLSSVVPGITEALEQAARSCFSDCNPLVIDSRLDFGMTIRYNPPADAGTDRLVNAVAAFAKYGGPAIVVDCGTATKFEAIAENGDYLGGAIAPGVRLSANALFQAGARLYRVPMTASPRAIGTGTVEAMQSGIVLGFASLVDGMVRRFQQELDPISNRSVPVIATGGLSSLLTGLSETITTYDATLTLDGLRLMWERASRESRV